MKGLLIAAISAAVVSGSLPANGDTQAKAKSNYTLPNGCVAASANDSGVYSAVLSDGEAVTLTPTEDLSSLTPVIYHVTESDSEAYAWMSGTVGDKVTDPDFYYIYFIDEFGNQVETSTVMDVSVSYDSDSTTIVGEIDEDGTVTDLDGTANNGTEEFTVSGGGYYVVAKSATTNSDSSTPDSSVSDSSVPDSGLSDSSSAADSNSDIDSDDSTESTNSTDNTTDSDSSTDSTSSTTSTASTPNSSTSNTASSSSAKSNSTVASTTTSTNTTETNPKTGDAALFMLPAVIILGAAIVVKRKDTK